MKNPTNIFFASVVVGAAGLAILLSPLPRIWGLFVIAFAAEAIRAGMVLINVDVRKVNPPQYWVVLIAVIIATIGIGMAIDKMAARDTMEWWAAQTINFLILAGEYSWAVLRAGAPIDWEMRALVAEGSLRKVSEQRDDLNTKVVDLREELEESNRTLAEFRGTLAKRNGELVKAEKSVAPHKSLLAVRAKKISVDKVRSQVCPNCDILVVPPSNSHKPDKCPDCQMKLEWNNG